MVEVFKTVLPSYETIFHIQLMNKITLCVAVHNFYFNWFCVKIIFM